MPLIDLLFKRLAVDFVGSSTSASDKGDFYVQPLLDYTKRYTETVPLKNINTETVVKALLDLYNRIEIPEEILGDIETLNKVCIRKCRGCCQSGG